MDVKIPRGVGVKKITGQRIRAEVTDVYIGYYAEDGSPVGDRIESWVIAQDDAASEYKIQHPQEFRERDTDFRIWVSGTWRWGPEPGQGMAKVTTSYYSESLVVAFYTGRDDPWPDTILYIYFTKPISEGQVPYLERHPAGPT